MGIDDPAYAIDVDISCSRCGYNLRGLDSGGRCPECGAAVGKSLIAHAEHRQGSVPLRLEDPEWLRWLVRGCWMLLLAMGIWVMLQVVPDRLARWPSWFRWLMTPAAFAAWGLTWVGIMMLTSHPAGAITERWGDWSLRWAVRVLVSFYTLMPIAIMLFPRGQYWRHIGAFGGPLIIFPLFLATILFYLWMRNLATRSSSIALATLFLLLSYLVSMLNFFTVGSNSRFYSPAPLEVMLSLPSPVFSDHEYFHDLVQQRRWEYWPTFDPAKMLVAGMPLLTIGAMGWFMMLVKLRLKESRRNEPAAAPANPAGSEPVGIEEQPDSATPAR